GGGGKGGRRGWAAGAVAGGRKLGVRVEPGSRQSPTPHPGRNLCLGYRRAQVKTGAGSGRFAKKSGAVAKKQHATSLPLFCGTGRLNWRDSCASGLGVRLLESLPSGSTRGDHTPTMDKALLRLRTDGSGPDGTSASRSRC